jgi:hypothetical protein
MIAPASIEVLGEECFSWYRSLCSITFQSGPRLSRIGKWAFSYTRLVEMNVRASVEVLGEMCFSQCRSLSSAPFESDSTLSRIEGVAFHKTGLIEINHSNWGFVGRLQPNNSQSMHFSHSNWLI